MILSGVLESRGLDDTGRNETQMSEPAPPARVSASFGRQNTVCQVDAGCCWGSGVSSYIAILHHHAAALGTRCFVHVARCWRPHETLADVNKTITAKTSLFTFKFDCRSGENQVTVATC